MGAFNPAIVTPDWLLSKQLIDEQDRSYVLQDGEDRFITSSVFSGGRYAWVTLEFSRESLHIQSTSETETGERVRELAVGLLAALPETPVGRVHLSHFMFLTLNQEQTDRLTATLAPVGPILEHFRDAQFEAVEYRSTRERGYADLLVEPSHRDGYQLYVEYERVWELADPPGVDPAVAVEVLDGEWEATQAEASAIVNHLIHLA